MDKSKLLRSLTVGRGAILTPHIDRYQAKEKFPPKWVIEIDNYKPHDKHFHPSGDCYKKPSTLYKDKLDLQVRRGVGVSLRRAFDAGHFWHGYVGSILLDMGFVKAENIERQYTGALLGPHGRFTVRGTGDLVGVDIPGHGSWLVDMKTMNSEEFQQGARPDTLKKWAAQTNIYADWFGFDKIMILAIQKDTPHEMREYIIEKDQKLIDSIYAKWSYVAACIRDKTPPLDDVPVL